MPTILVLTPLAIEHAALSDALTSLDVRDRFEVVVGGHGKVQFALSTLLMIQKFSPTLVVCAGAAGALSSEIQPLDVVVAEETIEHDFRMRVFKRSLPSFAGDRDSLASLRAADSHARTHFGKIASGDEDVVDRTRAKEIEAQTGALVVAWEGAGAARAAALLRVPFVEIRVVTDLADGRAAEDFKANVRAGMGQVANILRSLI